MLLMQRTGFRLVFGSPLCPIEEHEVLRPRTMPFLVLRGDANNKTGRRKLVLGDKAVASQQLNAPLPIRLLVQLGVPPDRKEHVDDAICVNGIGDIQSHRPWLPPRTPNHHPQARCKRPPSDTILRRQKSKQDLVLVQRLWGREKVSTRQNAFAYSVDQFVPEVARGVGILFCREVFRGDVFAPVPLQHGKMRGRGGQSEMVLTPIVVRHVVREQLLLTCGGHWLLCKECLACTQIVYEVRCRI